MHVRPVRTNAGTKSLIVTRRSAAVPTSRQTADTMPRAMVEYTIAFKATTASGGLVASERHRRPARTKPGTNGKANATETNATGAILRRSSRREGRPVPHTIAIATSYRRRLLLIVRVTRV